MSILAGTGFVSKRSWILVLVLDFGHVMFGIGKRVPLLHNPTLFRCPFFTVLNKALPPDFSVIPESSFKSAGGDVTSFTSLQ